MNFLLGGCYGECATEDIICLWLCPAGLAKQDSFTFSGKRQDNSSFNYWLECGLNSLTDEWDKVLFTLDFCSSFSPCRTRLSSAALTARKAHGPANVAVT